MILLVLLLAATFAVSAWLTARLAMSRSWLRILDTPNERSLHAKAIPRTGGVAILAAFVFGLGMCLILVRGRIAHGLLVDAAHAFVARDVVAIVAAALLLGAVSLWSDSRELHPALRLVTQCLVAGALVWIGDFAITGFSVPFVGVVRLGWLGAPVTLLFIVWMTNLYNFMDGMDGFAGGMALIGFGFLGSLTLADGEPDLGVLALIVAAASSGIPGLQLSPGAYLHGRRRRGSPGISCRGARRKEQSRECDRAVGDRSSFSRRSSLTRPSCSFDGCCGGHEYGSLTASTTTSGSCWPAGVTAGRCASNTC